ncbi:MAG: hypothetical protein V3S89_03395 [Desulfobacterales bacterium]
MIHYGTVCQDVNRARAAHRLSGRCIISIGQKCIIFDRGLDINPDSALICRHTDPFRAKPVDMTCHIFHIPG